MKHTFQRLIHFLLLLLTINSSSPAQPKSAIEPCDSKDSCKALLAYRLPWSAKFSEIATRFQVNVSDILAANNINPPQNTLMSSSSSAKNYQILPSNSIVKIPISCPCVDGIRRSSSTVYTVRAADTVDSISEGYGGLASPEQIRSANGGVDSSKPLVGGERLVVPLPCNCFDNDDNGATTVYMSYVVLKGQKLSRIADEYGTTVTDLETVNGLAQGRIRWRDILAVPLPACSSLNLNWRNDSLIIPNGSYALTANNCIKCSCSATDLSLQCSPSAIEASCSHLQCRGSNLFIGHAYEKHTDLGCNVTACVYRGHSGNKIFSSLLNFSHVQCSGNKSHAAVSSPTNGIVIPFLIFPPSPSPSSATNRPTVIVPSDPTRQQNAAKNSRGGLMLLNLSFYIGLLLLELALSFIL